MKKLLILAVSVIVGFILLGLLPVHGESEIYDSVVRLHVLANSDSDYDQALKLKVRDGVLVAASEIIADCTTREEAEAALSANLEKIKNAATAVIETEGATYPVSVDLGEEEYPTRSYESICFPSGTYMSLRVMIGEAEGKNWWCVLFPNLCIKAATKKEAEEAFIQAGLTPEQFKIITESDGTKYTVRFKILEILEELAKKCKAKNK
jgi:stage II sporulation protein R